MFVGDWIARRAALTPTKIALIDAINGRVITYRGWDEQVNRTARFLREGLGIARGDRVAILAANSVDYLDIWFALGALGGILQNLNWRLAVPELKRILVDAEPRALVYSDEFAPQVDALRGAIPSIQHWVAVDTPCGSHDLALGLRSGYPAG